MVSVKSLAALADRLVYWAAVVLLLTLLAVVVLGVFFRQINQPLAWSDELAQYLLVWTGFVGWIIAARRRSHIRIMVFAEKLPRPLQAALEIATQVAVVVFAGVLLRYSWALIERTWDVESIALPITSAGNPPTACSTLRRYTENESELKQVLIPSSGASARLLLRLCSG